MPVLSQRAAAAQWGMRRATLSADIKSGKVSATREGVDTSEMGRVYGKPKGPDHVPAPEPAPGATSVHPEMDAMNRLVQHLERELEASKAREAQAREQVERVLAQTLALLPAPQAAQAPEATGKKPGLWARVFGKG